MNNDKTIREIFDTLNECQKQELYGTIGDLLGDYISLDATIRSFELRDDYNEDQKKVVTIIFKEAMADHERRNL